MDLNIFIFSVNNRTETKDFYYILSVIHKGIWYCIYGDTVNFLHFVSWKDLPSGMTNCLLITVGVVKYVPIEWSVD